jgi:SAM-dependent methyltransferase
MTGMHRREAAYADEAAGRVTDPRAWCECQDAESLDVPGQFDVAVSGLVLIFLSDPTAVVRAMPAAVGHGGLVAAYVWDYVGQMQLLRHFWDAAVALDESARDLDERLRHDCDGSSKIQSSAVEPA